MNEKRQEDTRYRRSHSDIIFDYLFPEEVSLEYGQPGNAQFSMELLAENARKVEEEKRKKDSGKEIVFFITNKWSGSPQVDWESDDFKWVKPSDMSSTDMVPAPKIVFELIDAWAEMF